MNMQPTALARVDAVTGATHFYEVEVARDLFGTWSVLRTRWRARGRRSRERTTHAHEREAACAARGLISRKHQQGFCDSTALLEGATIKPAPAASADAIWRETEKIQKLLFSYCMAKSRCGRPSRQVDDASRAEYLLEALVARLVTLLAPRQTINDMHARQVVRQTILMVDATIRKKRRETADPKIVEVASRTLHPYLDYSVGSFFAASENGEAIVDALSADGIDHIGDLASSARTAIEGVLGDPALADAVKRELADVRLGLGMRVPQWRRRKA